MKEGTLNRFKAISEMIHELRQLPIKIEQRQAVNEADGSVRSPAFYCQRHLQDPLLFWLDVLAIGFGSGYTAGFGTLLAELFPTQIRTFAMAVTYNGARGVQFFAPLLVSALVMSNGFAGASASPLCLCLRSPPHVECEPFLKLDRATSSASPFIPMPSPKRVP
jgi:hypothetical protein